MTNRKYSSRAQQTTLSSPITSSATTMTVGSGSNLMGGRTPAVGETYTVVIDPDTALEEIVDVSNYTSGNTLTIARGIENSGNGVAHSAGAVVRHMVTGRDLQEANNHVDGTLAQHAATTSAELRGVISDETGTGSLVFATSPTLVTPALGTPASGVLTNTTGYTAANLAGLGTGVATFLATPSSANLAAALTDETGSGAVVLGTSPTIASPTITGTGAIAGTFTGNLTGNVTGNVSGTAGSATGNAGTATALATARNFQLTGDVEASAVSFDGTGNVSLTTVIGTGVIVNADINASAAIDKTKISGTAITAADSGTVTSAMIEDGTIVNGDINASAGITYGKLSLNGSITSADIVDGTIVNADINASAAIALSKLATDPLARANHTGTQTASTISDFDTQVRTSRLDQMAAPTASVALNAQKITGLADPTSNQDAVTLKYLTDQKGAANGIASLDGSGLIPTNQLPALAITETSVVVSQAAMLALTAQIGDVAVRTDVNKSFILTASPASTLGNWQELLTPTDAVLSVDGNTGAISLSGTYLNRTTGQLLGNLDANNFKVTGLGTPTSNADAATKVYVDTVAGSATAAAASAAAAATTYDNFDDRYLGAKSTAPSVDNDGDALIEGALYWNSVDNAMYAWDGAAWGSISSTAAIFRYKFVATGGETSVSGTDANGLTLSYLAGKEQVYLNGVLLVRGTDYTASNGTSITSLAALAASDILEIITFTAFDLATAIDKTLFDAKGDILVATAADTPGKLALGTNGYYLKVNTSTATGLEWAQVDLSAYATVATENDNTIMNIMGAY